MKKHRWIVILIILIALSCIFLCRISETKKTSDAVKKLETVLHKTEILTMEELSIEEIKFHYYTYGSWGGDGEAFFVIKLTDNICKEDKSEIWTAVPVHSNIKKVVKPFFEGGDNIVIAHNFFKEFNMFAETIQGKYFVYDMKNEIFVNKLAEEQWENYLQNFNDMEHGINFPEFYFYDHMLFCVMDDKENILYIFQREL